jgi:hypothetical protein
VNLKNKILYVILASVTLTIAACASSGGNESYNSKEDLNSGSTLEESLNNSVINGYTVSDDIKSESELILDSLSFENGKDIYSINGNNLAFDSNKDWEVAFSNTEVKSVGSDIAFDSKGNIYTTGSIDGEFDGNIYSGGSDIFISRISNTGEKQWTEQTGTAVYDSPKGISLDSKDNIYSPST